MCNSLCSSIATGTTKLVKNTAFPALLVTVGHLPKFQKYLPSISVTDLMNADYRINPGAIISYVGSKFNSISESILSTDIKGLGASLWESAKTIDIKGFGSSFWGNITDAVANAPSIFENHKVAIGVAAGVGASATIVDAVLKRMPVTKHTNPFLRLTVSIGLATGLTLYAAKEVFRGHTVDPQTIMDIAIKIGVIGGGLKVATVASRLALKTIRGSSDWVSWTVSGICTGFIGVTNVLDWGSLPTRLEVKAKGPKPSPTKEPEKNGSSPHGADLEETKADLEDKIKKAPKKSQVSKSEPSPRKEKEKKSEEPSSKSAPTPKKASADLEDISESKSASIPKKGSADLEDTES